MTTRRKARLDGTEPPTNSKVAIITMTMSRAFPHAAVSINALNQQLGKATRHFLLLNDKPDESVATAVAHPHRRFLCSGSNVGVAPGRNRLLQEALAWGADYVVVFDDDLIAPRDYIETLVDEYRSLQATTPHLGAIAPAILSHRFAENLVPCLSFEELSVSSEPPPATGVWHDSLRAATTVPTPGQIEHLGVRNWAEHYLGTGGRALRRYLQRSGWDPAPLHTSPTVVANDKDARKNLCMGLIAPIPVDALPGGVWCVASGVLREVGPIEEAFAPFGFEDAEWCIRATRKGLQNFCTPAALVAHDLQGRLSSRPAAEVFRTRSRARSLLIRMHATDLTMPQAIVGAFVESLDLTVLPAETQPAAVDAWVTGFVEGLTRSIDAVAVGDLTRHAEFSIRQANVEHGPLDLDIAYTIDSNLVRVTGLRAEWPDKTTVSAECHIDRGSRSERWRGSAAVTVNNGSALRRLVAPLLGNEFPERWNRIDTSVPETAALIVHLATSSCDHQSRLQIDLGSDDGPPRTTVQHSCSEWMPTASSGV